MKTVKTTWENAAYRYSVEGAGRAVDTRRREAQLLRWVHPFLHKMMVGDIRRAHVLDLRAQCMADEEWTARSANYLVQVVYAVLRAAHGWEWLSVLPAPIKPLKLPPARQRWLTIEQAGLLIKALPPTVADMATLALETGLRRANITGLRWEWVDLPAKTIWLPAAVMKARAPLSVPVEAWGMEVLGRWADKRRADCPYVFHNRGKMVLQPNGRAWGLALAKLGIDDFRWHDLRHTWASWHVQCGTPIAVLKEMGGWKTLSMVTHYAHLNTAQSRTAAQACAEWRG